MKIVSGKVGIPHVTSHEFRQIIEGTVGQGSCILKSGDNLEPELVSNNLIKIKSGMMAHHGNVSSVENYDEVELKNGTQGMKRIDLVVNRYTRNDETKIENNSLVCIMGTPDASNPVVPDYIAGNMQNGDLVDDCPFLEIHYDGINVTEVKKLLEVGMTNKDLSDKISGIKATKKSYSMTLDYNTYAKANMGYIEIPQADMDQLGVPISAMFKGKSSAPGNAYLSNGNDNKVYGYASSVDGTGTLIVTFLNI